jgi:uncharacterized membrane protein
VPSFSVCLYLRSLITDLRSFMSARYPELDLLRSLAILSMILYHLLYDLTSFYGYHIDLDHGGWWLMARVTANCFLFLVGISFAISYNRTEASKRTFKYIKRGLIVLGCGYLVSIATYIADPLTYVRFGILHLIGVAILLLPFFIRLKYWNLLIAIIIILCGYYVRTLSVESSWLLPFGLMRADFASVDYFPLLPWFGVPLIGLMIGQYCYVDHLGWRTRVWHAKPLRPSISIFTSPGRYALIIYLLHQPIILLILRLI